MQQADTVASNIQLALNGRSPNNKFAYSSLGEMLTLGPVDGSIVGLNGLVALDVSAA
jgi:NADH dehydrogenase FAD-containing subunit